MSVIEAEFIKQVPDWQERMAAEEADPRYREADRAREAASDASYHAAIALLNVHPTTLASVVAMLEYVDAYQVGGRTFPDMLIEDDESENQLVRPFEAFLSPTLATALRRIGGLPEST